MIILDNQEAIRTRQQRVKEERALEMNANAAVKEEQDRREQLSKAMKDLRNKRISRCSTKEQNWFQAKIQLLAVLQWIVILVAHFISRIYEESDWYKSIEIDFTSLLRSLSILLTLAKIYYANGFELSDKPQTMLTKSMSYLTLVI